MENINITIDNKFLDNIIIVGNIPKDNIKSIHFMHTKFIITLTDDTLIACSYKGFYKKCINYYET